MNYKEWEEGVPEEIRGDSLWKMQAYRLALFAADVGWQDVTKLMRDRRTLGLSDQLYRALGSVNANLAEGYSRSSGKDRARFYEYALGSTRESRGWYYEGRHILGAQVTSHRLQLLTQITCLLLTMVPQQRGFALHENTTRYEADHNFGDVQSEEDFDELLQNIPLA